MSAALPSAPRIPAEGDALNKVAFDITLRAVEDRLLEHDPSLAVASAAEVPAGVLEWLKTRPPLLSDACTAAPQEAAQDGWNVVGGEKKNQNMLDDAETLDAVYDMLEKLSVEEGESARDIYTSPRGACGSIWHKLGKAMQQHELLLRLGGTGVYSAMSKWANLCTRAEANDAKLKGSKEKQGEKDERLKIERLALVWSDEDTAIAEDARKPGPSKKKKPSYLHATSPEKAPAAKAFPALTGATGGAAKYSAGTQANETTIFVIVGPLSPATTITKQHRGATITLRAVKPRGAALGACTPCLDVDDDMRQRTTLDRSVVSTSAAQMIGVTKVKNAEPRVRPRASLRGGLRPRIERS